MLSLACRGPRRVALEFRNTRVCQADSWWCCAILIGDTRKHLHYIPISVRVLEVFLEVGFVLKEDSARASVEEKDNEREVERQKIPTSTRKLTNTFTSLGSPLKEKNCHL